MAILPLSNTVMPYPWGSREDLARLQGRPHPTPTPEAELWVGTHPRAPSLSEGVPLGDIIADDPVGVLGAATAGRFHGELPFLLKLLAAADPLSIQAHPDKARAESGFARENAAGIPLDAPHRNYRDDNHKAEIVVALSPFWALNGFRPRAEMVELLDSAGLEEIAAERSCLNGGECRDALKDFLRRILSLDRDRLARLDLELRAAAAGPLAARPEGAWLRRVLDRYPADPGSLCVLLLNLVRLEPGQAMACAAGCLHAYLEGFCVELMANSDNVLRGGLTSKHVDRDELVGILDFVGGPPSIIEAEAGRYPMPVEDFGLTRVAVAAGERKTIPADHGFEILLATGGRGGVDGIALAPGEAVAVTADHGPFDLAGELDVFRARAGPLDAFQPEPEIC